MKTLTREQIGTIRQNIRNRGIETLDLEYELTDHIASSVEEKMNMGVSFYDAFKNVMLTFGPFGMEKIQREKYYKLTRQGYRLFFKNLLRFITPPLVIATVALFIILYFLFSWLDQFINISIVPVLLFLAFFSYSSIYLFFITLKHKFTQLKVLSYVYYAFGVLPFYILFIPFLENRVFNIWFIISITVFFIFLQVTFFTVLKKSYKELIKLYPQVSS